MQECAWRNAPVNATHVPTTCKLEQVFAPLGRLSEGVAQARGVSRLVVLGGHVKCICRQSAVVKGPRGFSSDFSASRSDAQSDTPRADVTGASWIEIDFPTDVIRAAHEVLPQLQPLSGATL